MISKNDEAKMVYTMLYQKKEYERIFMCNTAKDFWNSLIITHQALNESFSSRNHVRKFLRALPTKWRLKLLEKDLEASKIKKEKYKYLALKARKVSSDKEESCLGSDEEYVMASSKKEIDIVQLEIVNQAKMKLLLSKEEDDFKKDEICLMALDNNEVGLKFKLEPYKWIKDSGCSRHMTGNKDLFSTYEAINGGLWYPKGTGVETILYSDSDHAGDYVDRKSTSDVCTFMGCCLTSWFSKKQTALAISTTEAEYVSARKACQQALWMKQALVDNDNKLDDIPILCDNKGAIDLSKNLVSIPVPNI
ncbi:hypothetical protein Tco_1516831 [Tanacetum coccineum]